LILRAEERRHALDWLAAGTAIGLGTLTKESTLAVSGMALLWLILKYRRAWRDVRRPLILLSAGFLFCLAPLLTRNIVVGAPPLAMSGQGIGNIMIGFVADMQPAGFSPLSERALEISREARGGVFATIIETIRAHKEDLGSLISHEFTKLRAIVDPFEVWNNTSYYYGRDISPALAPTLGYGVIFPLGLAGALVLLPAWRQMGLFYSYLLASGVVQMITFVLARFRLSFVPVLILGAAFLLVQIVSTIRRRQIARGVALVTIALLISLAQQIFAPIANRRSAVRTQEYILASKVYAQDKRFDLAVLEMSRLHEKLGQTTPQASMVEGHVRIGLAEELMRQGDRDAARQQVQLAEKLYAEASDATGQSLYNLGVIYFRLGERDIAKAFFDQYLNLHPEGSKADKIRELLSSTP